MDERESALPSNTAPGGHTCPTCYDQIFPSPNLISPVADVLRNRLKETSWGRDEFGAILVCQLINENDAGIETSVLNVSLILSQKPNAAFSDTTKQNQFQSSNNNSNNTDDNMPQKTNNMNSLSSTSANKSSMSHESPKDHSINIENAAPYYQGKYYTSALVWVFN